MARIGDEEIQRLKQEIALERLVEAKGVKLKRHGKDLVGLCPFHDDREPSLVVTPDKNLWHCLGACQAGGSVIDWVMRAEGVSFRHAIELLRQGIPSLAVEAAGGAARKPVKRSTVQKLDVVGATSIADDQLLRDVARYYHETLKQSPEALAYLEKRGLRNDEAIEKFQLGYANRTLGYHLPHKNRQAGMMLRTRYEELGIYRASGHEHFSGSLVIPVFDERGLVVEMYGRKISPRLRPGTPLHLYLPGPHRGVWNAAELSDATEIILCESLIDALTFWCSGFRNVTAAYGVEGFTDEHRDAFARWEVERVLIAYDRDEAGERAAEKLAPELAAMGKEVFRIWFPKGQDANEFATKVRPARKVLELVIRQAWWMAGTKRYVADAPEASSAPESQRDLEPEPPPEPPSSPEPTTASTDDAANAGEVLEASEASPAPSSSPETPASEPTNSAPEIAEPTAAVVDRAPPAPVIEPAPVDAASEATTAAPTVEPLPSLAADPPPPCGAEREGDDIVFRFGDRRWRVRKIGKSAGPESLRVNLLVARDSGAFHVDTLELYSARQRGAYVKQAAEELTLEERIIKHELGVVLLKLEEHAEEQRKAAESEKQRAEMNDAERTAALELLRDPKLFDRILDDFARAGVVGEETNKLVGYLAATSRKLDEPLAVIIQSSSAAGKSSLMDAVLSLMPEEERVQYSAMTGQSLFYMGETDLAHKILAIVEEEGAERAAYALKLLQSEGELTIASTGKDPATGRLVTQEYRVEGPVMIFLTTTAIEVDEELLNRCVVLTVDEGREQTRAIHERQRLARTLEGVVARRERTRIQATHQNAQRLLRPLAVVNPYAPKLGFPDTQTRSRRDHMKYLALIEAIALLHQYQREVKEIEHRGEKLRYIEVTTADIALANRLAHEVLGRSADELPPQTRRVLGLIEELVGSETKRLGIERADFRFSRRQLRERTDWGDTQLRVHLARLVELEYLLAHRGRQGQSFSYELAWWGADASGPQLPGLVSADELDEGATAIPTSRGPEADFAGGERGSSGGRAGGERTRETSASTHQNGSKSDRAASGERNAHRGNGVTPATPYAQPAPPVRPEA
jgi:DNA primase